MTATKRPLLGLFSIVLFGFNTMIGTGTYLLPSKPMALVGPSSILVYLLVTVIVLAIALCFAECATFFSRNGAAYLYAKEAFGDFVGYQVGVLKWVVCILAWAAASAGFVMILGEIWPSALEEPFRTLIVISLLGFLGLINIMGVKHIKIINNIVAITKLVPLFLFIGFGLFYLKAENFFPFIPANADFGDVGEASLIIFFAFSGFETFAVAAEEMHNPKKNIPLAIIIVLLTVAVTYLLIQFIVVGVLGEALATSVAPIADAGYLFFGTYGRAFILGSTLISSFGMNIACSFATPRVVEVLAKDGFMPKILAKKSAYDTPYIGIIVSVVLACLAGLSGSFITLATISVVARLCQYIPTCLAVFILRRKYTPQWVLLPKSLEVAVPVMGVVFALWLLASASMNELIWGAGALVAGLPLYLFVKKDANPSLEFEASSTDLV